MTKATIKTYLPILFRILGAELKNMAHLDAASNLQGAGAARTGVATDNFTNIGKFRIGHVAFPGGAFDVIAVFIGATNKIRHLGGGVINDHSDGSADRPE